MMRGGGEMLWHDAEGKGPEKRQGISRNGKKINKGKLRVNIHCVQTSSFSTNHFCSPKLFAGIHGNQ